MAKRYLLRCSRLLPLTVVVALLNLQSDLVACFTSTSSRAFARTSIGNERLAQDRAVIALRQRQINDPRNYVDFHSNNVSPLLATSLKPSFPIDENEEGANDGQNNGVNVRRGPIALFRRIFHYFHSRHSREVGIFRRRKRLFLRALASAVFVASAAYWRLSGSPLINYDDSFHLMASSSSNAIEIVSPSSYHETTSSTASSNVMYASSTLSLTADEAAGIDDDADEYNERMMMPTSVAKQQQQLSSAAILQLSSKKQTDMIESTTSSAQQGSPKLGIVLGGAGAAVLSVVGVRNLRNSIESGGKTDGDDDENNNDSIVMRLKKSGLSLIRSDGTDKLDETKPAFIRPASDPEEGKKASNVNKSGSKLKVNPFKATSSTAKKTPGSIATVAATSSSTQVAVAPKAVPTATVVDEKKFQEIEDKAPAFLKPQSEQALPRQVGDFKRKTNVSNGNGGKSKVLPPEEAVKVVLDRVYEEERKSAMKKSNASSEASVESITANGSKTTVVEESEKIADASWVSKDINDTLVSSPSKVMQYESSAAAAALAAKQTLANTDSTSPTSRIMEFERSNAAVALAAKTAIAVDSEAAVAETETTIPPSRIMEFEKSTAAVALAAKMAVSTTADDVEESIKPVKPSFQPQFPIGATENVVLPSKPSITSSASVDKKEMLNELDRLGQKVDEMLDEVKEVGSEDFSEDDSTSSWEGDGLELSEPEGEVIDDEYDEVVAEIAEENQDEDVQEEEELVQATETVEETPVAAEQPKQSEDVDLAAKYAAISDVGERAFQILMDLGMVGNEEE